MTAKELILFLVIVSIGTFTVWGIMTVNDRMTTKAEQALVAELEGDIKTLTEAVLSLQKAVLVIQSIIIMEEGKASWYGKPFHGRKTASGEVYDMYKISAAHKTLPLGSWVRVFNLKNGRVLDLRLNDRGPFIEGRIIDLSYAAAQALDMVEDGVVNVKIITINNS